MTKQAPKKPRRTARPAPGAGEAGEQPVLPATAKRPTKQSLVLDLLRQPGGVALATIVETTGWLPHTTRAVLTKATLSSARGPVTRPATASHREMLHDPAGEGSGGAGCSRSACRRSAMAVCRCW